MKEGLTQNFQWLIMLILFNHEIINKQWITQLKLILPFLNEVQLNLIEFCIQWRNLEMVVSIRLGCIRKPDKIQYGSSYQNLRCVVVIMSPTQYDKTVVCQYDTLSHHCSSYRSHPGTDTSNTGTQPVQWAQGGHQWPLVGIQACQCDTGELD